jgi:phosphoribosylformylglycinamidine synthase
MIAVAEAARNVVCVGAVPVAITNCLNFGNPYDPEVYWTFKEAIRGMGDACKALNTPVTGGNVSFHNESKSRAIFPTPTIGMLGLIDDLRKRISLNFKNVNDKILLLGSNRNELGGSEYLKVMHNLIAGEAPYFDIEEEKNLQTALLKMIDNKLIEAAHDCSEGGLAITLAEMSIFSNKLGCEVRLHQDCNAGTFFGESQSRIVIEVEGKNIKEVIRIANEYNVPIEEIGVVVEYNFKIDGCVVTTVEKLIEEYELAIPRIIG